MAFSWTCPFCNHKATIQKENSSSDAHYFDCNNKYGRQSVQTHVVCCPNEDCKEYTLEVSLHDTDIVNNGWKTYPSKQNWSLIPQADIKLFPDYVPEAILNDYAEACAIKDLSPKASATLARRCLQGMIRDFWGVKQKRLVDEIEAIKDKVDSTTWSAIDSVRTIGNIGAHMERDIDLIIEVEPNEAGLLINLIETLISDWYVTRKEREIRMNSIIAIAEEKSKQK